MSAPGRALNRADRRGDLEEDSDRVVDDDAEDEDAEAIAVCAQAMQDGRDEENERRACSFELVLMRERVPAMVATRAIELVIAEVSDIAATFVEDLECDGGREMKVDCESGTECSRQGSSSRISVQLEDQKNSKIRRLSFLTTNT